MFKFEFDNNMIRNYALFSLEFGLVYAIPEIITEPALDSAYQAVKLISKAIIETTKSI